MPTFTKLKSGSWRVQVRRKREYVANTFIRRRDAEEWAIEVERSIDRGVPIRRSRPHEQPRIFSDLIALHLDDLAQVGKPVRRSKSMVLKALKTSLGRVNLKDITPREIDRVRKEASRTRRWAGNPCDRFLFHSSRAHARCGGPRNRGFCGECSVGPGCAEAPRSRGEIKRARSPSHSRRTEPTDRIC